MKQFVEERDLTIPSPPTCRLDGFGSVDRRKIDLASELIAVLAFDAEQNGDRVGLVLFESGVKRSGPAARAHTHTARGSGGARGGSALGGVVSWERFERFVRQIREASRGVIVLSIFFDAGSSGPQACREARSIAIGSPTPVNTIFQAAQSSGVSTQRRQEPRHRSEAPAAL